MYLVKYTFFSPFCHKYVVWILSVWSLGPFEFKCALAVRILAPRFIFNNFLFVKTYYSCFGQILHLPGLCQKLFFHYSMTCKWFIHTDGTKRILLCHGYMGVRLLDNVFSDHEDSTLKLGKSLKFLLMICRKKALNKCFLASVKKHVRSLEEGRG